MKLSYSAALFRVKVELTTEACLASETPPPDVVARAKTKMEVVKGQGEVAFFVVYESRLKECWRLIRESAEPGKKLVITLAAGAPQLAGVHVERATQEKVLALLSIDAPRETIATWRYEWFKLFVVKRMRELGIKDAPNNAQLFGAFMRSKAGEKLDKVAVGSAAALATAVATKPFSVIANKQRQEIAVVIRSPADVTEGAPRDAMLSLIAQAIRHMSDGGAEFRVHKKDFLQALNNAENGVESMGLELPLVLLAAVGAAPLGAAPGAPKSLGPSNFPGAGKLELAVSKDKMEATITNFKSELYHDPSFQVSVEWVQLEMKRQGIAVDLPDETHKQLAETIRAKDPLDGILVARGTPGMPNKGPYLHKSWLDAEVRAGSAGLEGDLDLREMQQRSLVKAHQLIAQIKFQEPGSPGKTIYAEDVPPPPDEQLIVHMGEGIQQREGRFYATVDGIPGVEGNAITLSKVLLHNGDVNLRSGNIRFNGPVEIKGSIDVGAVVETSGDLIVHGSIRGGKVRVRGNMTVTSGIITGTAGIVEVKGDLKAEFIENSRIVCGGALTVDKVVISSTLIVGKTIKMKKKDSVLAGGRINAGEAVHVGTLGFKNGARTEVSVGVDWRIARAVDIRKGRIEKLQKRLGEDRVTLRELVQRKTGQLTQKHKEMKDELQERLQRGRPLLEKAEMHLAKARTALTYNPAARIYVSETLFANVSLELGGQPVAVVMEVAGVCVVAKRRRGSHIVPIEEIEAEDKQELGKAS